MTTEPVPQFTCQRRVEFADTDMAGIIHFSSYYRYMEECEHAYLRSLGFSVVLKLPDGDIVSWPRVRTSCAYYVPVRFEDVLDVRLFVVRKGVKSLTYDIEFLHDGKRIARGSLKTVCCLHKHANPLISIPIPEEMDRLIQESPHPLPKGSHDSA